MKDVHISRRLYRIEGTPYIPSKVTTIFTIDDEDRAVATFKNLREKFPNEKFWMIKVVETVVHVD